MLPSVCRGVARGTSGGGADGVSSVGLVLGGRRVDFSVAGVAEANAAALVALDVGVVAVGTGRSPGGAEAVRRGAAEGGAVVETVFCDVRMETTVTVSALDGSTVNALDDGLRTIRHTAVALCTVHQRRPRRSRRRPTQNTRR